MFNGALVRMLCFMQAREEAIANTGSVGMADAHEDDIILFSDIDEALLGWLFYDVHDLHCVGSAQRLRAAGSECSSIPGVLSRVPVTRGQLPHSIHAQADRHEPHCLS